MNNMHDRWLIILLGMLLISQIACSEEVGSSQQSIKNGDPVPITEFEAVGSLRWRGFSCTATLIEPDLVLTAAHCVCPEDESREGCGPQAIFTLKNVRPVDSPETRRDISMTGSVSLHPKFATDSNWLSNDFAIVRLNQKVTDIAFVKPISVELPTQRPELGDNLTIVGFGRTGDDCNSSPFGKRKVTLPLYEISTDNVTLRIGTSSAGACPGDSGGPALNAAGNIVGVSSTNPGNYDPTDLAYNWIYPDTFTVKSNGVHGFHFEGRDQHQFNLVSVYPLTVNGVLNYEWDNVRDPGQFGFIRRLNILNQSNFPVSFRRLVRPVALDNVPHTVEKNETASVQAKGKHGFHFEIQDKHQFYLESVYPITMGGRITYEWDNVRDPGDSRFIRRLTVINKSNFPVIFKIKVIKMTLGQIPIINVLGLIKTPLFNETASVQANGKHGFHFERQDRHQFYLESIYPTTVNGRITYRWNNVRDPGSSGFKRRLTIFNKSGFPVTFKLKVLGVTLRDKPVIFSPFE